jgi:hypothetical protein
VSESIFYASSYILLSRNSFTIQAFSRVRDFRQHILTDEVSSADDPDADGEAFAIASEPTLGGTYHGRPSAELLLVDHDQRGYVLSQEL